MNQSGTVLGERSRARVQLIGLSYGFIDSVRRSVLITAIAHLPLIGWRWVPAAYDPIRRYDLTTTTLTYEYTTKYTIEKSF